MNLDWYNFVLRSDIVNLPLSEQRSIFLREQLQLENLLSQQRQYEHQMQNYQPKGPGGSGTGFSGNASDGPLSGATVTSNVGSATTNALGIFTLPSTPSGEITVTGGTDAITGVTFTGELKGFPEYSTISPLTTLAYHLKEEDASLTTDTAIDLLFVSSSTLFGIELEAADKDVMLNKDYVAESILFDNQKAVAAQSIATYLESVTQVVGSALVGADSSNFTTNNAKVEGYKSIARQIQGTSGAKTEINPQTLFDVVKLPNGSNWTSTGSLNTSARANIKTQLFNVKNELGSLARSTNYSANYLTTKIQAVNRGAKEDYAVEAEKLAKGQSATFDDIDAMIGKSTGSLAQIQEGKPNETTRTEGEKDDVVFYTFGDMTFTQTSGGTTSTLSGDRYVSGSIKAISSATNSFSDSDALGKFLIKSNGDSMYFEGATNYNSRLPIIATQTTATTPNISPSRRVYKLTLSNRLQITNLELIAEPVSNTLLAGSYTLQTSTDGRSYTTPRSQPFTTIASGQTSVTTTVDRVTYKIEYSSANSRYEYSVGGVVQYFTNSYVSNTVWTRVSSRDPFIRFSIR